MRQVVITVGNEGEVAVEARGIVGTGCKAVTEAFERALGATTGDTLKPEFNQRPAVNQQQKAGQ